MKNPMQAFAGVDFDCIFWDFDSAEKISTLIGIAEDGYFIPDNGVERGNCRPRINKAQVLTDYTPILVDGLVWRVSYRTAHGAITHEPVLSEVLKELRHINWIAFKGVEKGSEYEEWARANDVPIYNKNMELVA